MEVEAPGRAERDAPSWLEVAVSFPEPEASAGPVPFAPGSVRKGVLVGRASVVIRSSGSWDAQLSVSLRPPLSASISSGFNPSTAFAR